jgi:hypothetical protein
MRMATRHALAIGAAALALAAAGPAAAATQVTSDSAGRPINFDVQDQGADVAGYTAILDGLLHGDEISDVTVTIVAQSAIPANCGAGAAACYRWSTRGGAVMFVPNLPAAQVRGALTHEYGHHVDATRPHLAGARGLDGTAGWWRVRGMATFLAQGQVAWDYSLGWDRSIAEVFAEDYKLTNAPAETSRIGWLGPPPQSVTDAIRTDLAGPTVAPAPPAQPPQPPPAAAGRPPRGAGLAQGPRVTARARGWLRAGQRTRIPFAVAAGRRVAVTVGGVTAGRVRAVLRCNGRTLSGAAARRGRPVTLRSRRTSRSACSVGLRAIGAPSRYRVLAATARVG